MTAEDVANYVPEPEDKRTQAEWDAMTLEELRAEWQRGPRFEKPPYPQDRNRYRRLTKVRGEIAIRSKAKPPDGVTYGKGKKSGES